MAGTVAIGIQQFNEIRKKGYFYIDKTAFIREWWEKGDSVTLITRPRRFGKTLTMSMVEQFFSVKYAGQHNLFEGLAIWETKAYREIQGTYPVISLSFANLKEPSYELTRQKVCDQLQQLYTEHAYILESGILKGADKSFFERMLHNEKVEYVDATLALYKLSSFMYQYYGKKVLILLDEYDTPMQEAYINDYWNELTVFMRSLLNAAFKTNPWLERAIMTGITRVSKESIFSDLNNLKVITTTSDEYADAFGFTEKEVFEALEERGLGSEKQKVKDEIAARFSKKNWLVKALPIAYCAIGVLLMTAVPVYADDIFATAKNAMQTVYTDVAGIATVAAVVCAAVCLFLMNFSKSGRTVDESRSWLKRIVICWAALMTLGAIVTYLEKIIPQSMFTG